MPYDSAKAVPTSERVKIESPPPARQAEIGQKNVLIDYGFFRMSTAPCVFNIILYHRSLHEIHEGISNVCGMLVSTYREEGFDIAHPIIESILRVDYLTYRKGFRRNP